MRPMNPTATTQSFTDTIDRPPAGPPAPPAPAVAVVGAALIDREPLLGATRAARRDGIDPVTFETTLLDAGWPAGVARAAADRLTAADDRPMTWWTWYGSLGVMVASFAAAGHAAFEAAHRGALTTGTGTMLASALTLAFVALPFAVWGWWLAKRAVQGAGRWSPTRRALVDVLMWGTGVVAVGRALVYLSEIFRGLFIPGVENPSIWSLGQVAVTVVAAGGLFVFGWRERMNVRTRD
jgi:hypothetical protein